MEKKKEKCFKDYGYRRGHGWIKKGETDFTFEQYIESYIDNAALDSEKLRVLLFSYERGRFEACLQELFESEYISKEERKLIIDAQTVGACEVTQSMFQKNPKEFKEQFKAVSSLVKANPDAMQFPFVHKAMSNLIKLYSDAIIKRKSPDKFLEVIKDLWTEFLPLRQGGNIPYKANDLQRLLDTAIEKGYTKDAAINIMADKLSISREKLIKDLRVKNTKGRPKKICKLLLK